MQNIAAAWLMTSLAPSPLYVALVQTATSLPIFLIGLPAGALADIVDRRRMLVVTQTWMLLAAAVLGVTTLYGLTTPWVLLGLTFALGLGATMNGPAWQAIVPELVPREQLPEAVALNSVGFNLARSVGPALGGVLVATLGVSVAFLLNALSFVAVVAVLLGWKRPPHRSMAAAERMMSAIRAGVRYVRHDPPMVAVLVRAGMFVTCASAVWAVLPLIARVEIGQGSAGYGILVGSFGAGSVLGAVILSRLRRSVPVQLLLSTSSATFAVAAFSIASLRVLGLVAAAMALAGMCWMAQLSTLNVSAQQSLPSWVRARGMGVYLLVFQGGMAVGAFLWGLLAERVGMPAALMTSAACQALTILVAARFPLADVDIAKLEPSAPWPEPLVAGEPEPEAGPVMVVVEYNIDPARVHDFHRAISELGRIRRRSGASRWALLSDAADPRLWREVFLVESWGEHLRQHARVTAQDREIEQEAARFHTLDEPPKVAHWIAVAE